MVPIICLVGAAASALRGGGILCAYLPTINQTAQLREALRSQHFGLEETTEVKLRKLQQKAYGAQPVPARPSAAPPIVGTSVMVGAYSPPASPARPAPQAKVRL